MNRTTPLHQFQRAVKVTFLSALLGLPAQAQGATSSFGKLFQNSAALSALTKSVNQAGGTTPSQSPLAQAATQVTTGTPPTTFKYPLSKTDFKFQGKPTQQKVCGDLTEDPEAAKQLSDVCLNAFNEIEKLPIFRKSNFSAAMTLLIVTSLQVYSGQEISDEDGLTMQRSMNDLLVDGGFMTKTKPADVQKLYEVFTMYSGFMIGINAKGNEDNDQELIDTAKTIAKGVLEMFGFQVQ